MPIQSKQQPPYYNTGQLVQVYRALITQTSTNAPTAKVLTDTIGGTPIYGYDGLGNYRITNTGKFPIDKTSINIAAVGYYIIGAGRNDTNSFFIQSNNHDGSPVDGAFTDTLLEIITYT